MTTTERKPSWLFRSEPPEKGGTVPMRLGDGGGYALPR
jgi:hypothetical protein